MTPGHKANQEAEARETLTKSQVKMQTTNKGHWGRNKLPQRALPEPSGSVETSSILRHH